MRWAHMQRAPAFNYGPDSTTLISTPLYSNTTLVAFFPPLAMGGTVLLMTRFDVAGYLSSRRDGASRTPCSCRSNISASWRIRLSASTT